MGNGYPSIYEYILHVKLTFIDTPTVLSTGPPLPRVQKRAIYSLCQGYAIVARSQLALIT